jgi:Ni,Fe-hydrogenase III large subunit
VLTTPTGKKDLATIVDLFPAAQWDEREAHDLYGLRFDGHEPLRPLVVHSPDTERWTVPVEGDGVHEVAVGPIHAGVIESGHFRFHVVGERILHLDLRLFYKHRGLQRAAEGQELADGLAFAQRACGACAVANSVAYAQACESVLGLTPSRELRRARTLLLELERLYNHLNDIAAVCAGVGFATGNMAFAALKERAMRLNASLAGHRFLFGSIQVGASRLELASSTVDRTRGELRGLRQDAAQAWREIRFAVSVQARLGGVGVLDRDSALELGAVGPVARASGVRLDTRTSSPGLWYGSSFAAAAPAAATGDVVARLELRASELETTLEVLDELLSEPMHADTASPGGEATPVGVARVESPRGETVCVVELEAHRIGRLHLRTGSYANWPALAHASAGNLLPDFPLINKSFELCYACVDR